MNDPAVPAIPETAPAPTPTVGLDRTLTVLRDADLALSIIAEVGVLNPAAAGVAKLVEMVDRLAIGGLTARKAITGKPLDPAAVHQLALVP